MAQISYSELEDKDNDSWTLRAENPSWHGYGEDSASAKSSAMESLRCMTYVILLLVSQGSKNPLLLLLFLQILLIMIFLTANDCSLYLYLVSYMTKCLLKPNMIVHAKMKIQPLFTHPHILQSCMTLYLLWNIKDLAIYWKIWFQCWFEHDCITLR